jgi:transposase
MACTSRFPVHRFDRSKLVPTSPSLVGPEQSLEPSACRGVLGFARKGITMVSAVSGSSDSVFAGVDVSKHRLDLSVGHRSFSVANDAAGVTKLMARLPRTGMGLIAIEATGGYERLLVNGLLKSGRPVAVVNPLRVRRFAQSRGVLAKTDKIDADVLEDFARLNTDKLRPMTAPGKNAAMLKELSARRRQLVCQVTANKNQLEHVTLAVVKRSIGRTIKQLQAEILLVEAEIQKQIDADPLLKARNQALLNVKGVGTRVALVLISELPELGALDRRKIAAVVGVAPFHDQSGTHDGPRHIQGGRPTVRSALYMSTLVGVRHDPVLKAHYEHLLKNGKPEKVALVACMRKRLNHLPGLLQPENLQQST